MGDQRETVIRRRTGWQGSFLRVQVDDVRLPSGRETAREYVDHPGSVAILPLTTDGSVLMIRQYRSPVQEMLLEIPAGTCGPNEAQETTARRELAEEIGYEAEALTEIARYYASPGYTNEVVTLFVARNCVPVDAVSGEEETIEPVRIPVAEVPRLLADPSQPVADATALIALQWLCAHDPM